MAEQLYGIRGAFDGSRELSFTWLPAEFLAARKVMPWGDMPTWVPRNDPDYAGENVSITRARAAGLTFRPLSVTAIDSLEWFNAQPPEAQERMLKSAGLPAERERDVLSAWHAAKR